MCFTPGMKTIAAFAFALAVAGCSKGQEPAAPADPAAVADPVEPAAATDHPVVGKKAPDFTLDDLDGNQVSLASFAGKAVVLEWFNPGCPFVKRAHSAGSLVDAANRHTGAGVVWLAINSGGPGNQGADPADNKAAAAQWKLTHPILLDPSGTTGKAYGATNTPHMFVIDKSGTVVYGGAIDNSPDAEGPVARGRHVDQLRRRGARGARLGRRGGHAGHKPYGCSVKYGA